MVRVLIGWIWSLLGRLLHYPGTSVLGTAWSTLGRALGKKDKWYWTAADGALVVIVWAVAFLLILGGCTSATQRANKIEKQIHEQTAAITDAATRADGHIIDADKKVEAAQAVPANPPQTGQLLGGAREDLGAAHKALSPIVPAAAKIDDKAREAAAVTGKVAQKLAAERDNWLGYKTRRFIWIAAIVAPIFGILVFIVRTNGGGPLLAAIGAMAGPIGRGLWWVIKALASSLWHVTTLGLDALAKLVNRKWDEQHPAPPASPTPAPDPTDLVR